MASDVSRSTRADVARRARHRCEYCLIHEEDTGFPHEIDHIISRKHGGSSESDNLALSCFPCNRNKGTDVAAIRVSGEALRFFDPRHDAWVEHFRLDGARIAAMSEIGAVTIRILRMNDLDRISERQALQALSRYPR